MGFGGGLGLVMMIQGFRGKRVLPEIASDGSANVAEFAAWAAAGLFVAIITFALTGWFVLAVAFGGLVMRVPRVRAESQAKEDMDRTKAIATWTEMVRDNMAGAAGLEQALVLAAEYAPAKIYSELSLFTRSLDHMPLEEALPRLGEDLNHPASDMVVVALTNAARMQASDLGPLLSRLASTTRDDVRLRQRVGIEAAKIKTSSRIVLGVTGFVAVFLYFINPELVAAYDSAEGQVVLTVVFMVFGAGIWSIRRYSKPEEVDRFTARRRVTL